LRRERKKISSALSVASTRNIDSIFTPIERADSGTQRFQEVEELKSKIGEMKVFKKLKFDEVED
jgi:hypothetical protein